MSHSDTLNNINSLALFLPLTHLHESIARSMTHHHESSLIHESSSDEHSVCPILLVKGFLLHRCIIIRSWLDHHLDPLEHLVPRSILDPQCFVPTGTLPCSLILLGSAILLLPLLGCSPRSCRSAPRCLWVWIIILIRWNTLSLDPYWIRNAMVH